MDKDLIMMVMVLLFGFDMERGRRKDMNGLRNCIEWKSNVVGE